MNSLKPSHWAGIVLGVVLFLYLYSSHLSYLHYFGDISFLGGIVLLEIIIAGVWKYEQRFFVLLMVAFTWAGMSVPLQGAWRGGGRWLVLSVGAGVGFIIWTKTPLRPFRSQHLVAFFCVCAAFTSATVSPWTQMASLKALSLLLLFLYCTSGARLAVLGREDRFFRGLLWGSEFAVYVTMVCYFGLGEHIWNNPNALGGTLAVGVFPLLLWGWLISDAPALKLRRLSALLLCTYLVFFSMARAGMVSVVVVTLVFCFCLRQYKLLVKVAALVLVMVAINGMLDPAALNKRLGEVTDAVLYKGHKEKGLVGSRRTPWEQTTASIKEHPWFGTGYGTSPTGVDPGLDFGTVSSSAETAREHGSSYMTIMEWVGLLGIVPFVALLALTASNVWKVCVWMRRTADPRHYSIPLAMVVLSGLVHAGFEDWLFAVGAYLCVYFWVLAFLLVDLIPVAVSVPVAGIVSRASRPLPSEFEAVAPSR
jgi:O-antigen ligase